MDNNSKKIEQLPDPAFLTLKQCVDKRRLDCDEDSLVTYIRQGSLNIYILVEDKYLVTYTIDTDGEKVEPRTPIPSVGGGAMLPFRMLLGHYFRIDNKHLGKIIAEGTSLIENVFDAQGTRCFFDKTQEPIIVSKESLYLAVSEVSAFYYTLFPPVDAQAEKTIAVTPTDKTTVSRKDDRKKPSTRSNELHGCIGKVIAELKNENNKFPTTDEAWRTLKGKKGKDEFECIQDVRHDNKRNEETISWKSMYGNEGKMCKSTFVNVVSKYKTGKKKLPDTQ